MNHKGTLDPRYRTNIDVGMRVMIKEEGNSDLMPCYVKEILTKDVMNEMGVMVLCEDGVTGRIQYIGTEAAYMSSMDLITSLETKLRSLIVAELSGDNPDWWENKIHPTVKEKVMEKKQKGERNKYVLQIPDYKLIEEVYFSDLHLILLSKNNWKKHFEKIFHNADALRVKLSELSSCRNLPAHSKELTEHLKKKIHVYYDDIILLMETYRRQPELE